MSSDANTISAILSIVLICMIVLLMLLSVAYIILRSKAKRKEKEPTNKEKIILGKSKKENSNKPISTVNYNKQSIFNFMEFEEIIDNMIVQKNGKRYLMIVECQGINYDLMSKMEKVGVEEGFQQFLNTLRHPIQIYIQTRTINLEGSIKTYQEKVKQIENDYSTMQYNYNRMREDTTYSQDDLNRYFYELTKKRNLLEYGKDIIYNTEKMSLNKSVLTKKYYVVIPYMPEDTADYSKDEISNMAFSELYTKSQAIIRTLSACSISGKILDSNELIDLMYVAYNRDDSEIYGVDKAVRAHYDDLYSTSVDVFDKKIVALNKEIEEKATELANSSIEKAKSRKQMIVEQREKEIDSLISEMAENILNENRKYIKEDVIDEAIKELKEERGEENVQQKKETRGRKRKTEK